LTQKKLRGKELLQRKLPRRNGFVERMRLDWKGLPERKEKLRKRESEKNRKGLERKKRSAKGRRKKRG